MRTFARRGFYTLAFLQYAVGMFVRWAENSRPEAGYWIACAIMDFLIGYIIFAPTSTTTKGR